jgi:hypothetical protein
MVDFLCYSVTLKIGAVRASEMSITSTILHGVTPQMTWALIVSQIWQLCCTHFRTLLVVCLVVLTPVLRPEWKLVQTANCNFLTEETAFGRIVSVIIDLISVWAMMPYTPIGRYEYFALICCLHLQGRRVCLSVEISLRKLIQRFEGM